MKDILICPANLFSSEGQRENCSDEKACDNRKIIYLTENFLEIFQCPQLKTSTNKIVNNHWHQLNI